MSHLLDVGTAQWLDEQYSATPTLHCPTQTAAGTGSSTRRYPIWWDISLHAPDQLRQRVAFALSEILVISDKPDVIGGAQLGVCYYYDLLVQGAFGNFRQLLQNITLAPSMGYYLSMLHNQKPDPASGIRSDENFAREVMQLFTIGLFQLNIDGTPRLDTNGQQIPTYAQIDIENLARVFTGWAWPNAGTFLSTSPGWSAPMKPFDGFHDRDPKTIVDNTAIPAGGTTSGDLGLALDTLFNHPNVGPFIGRRLIQRLVTSNPSPAYQSRVTAIFNDNGRGVRGDLGAVIRAILTDPEARNSGIPTPTFGKQREPLIGITNLWRAFNASARNGRYAYTNLDQDLGQAPVSANSVFNFFSPFYSPLGAIEDAGLVAPELQIADESSLNYLANIIYQFAVINHSAKPNAPDTDILVDYTNELPLAATPYQLIDELNLLLMNGQMSSGMGTALLRHLLALPDDPPLKRVQDAVYLIMTSPQYWTQR